MQKALTASPERASAELSSEGAIISAQLSQCHLSTVYLSSFVSHPANLFVAASFSITFFLKKCLACSLSLRLIEKFFSSVSY